uniref:Tubulin, delta 1 n=1 Tax=Hucho hucho TaxID=62062 RepID=A0A4W5Q6J6_9TELE
MYIVTVQLGQCGNQVVQEFEVISNDANDAQRDCKQSIAKAAKFVKWRYGDHSHFSQKQGSGNNWHCNMTTLCFHFFVCRYCVHGPRHEEVVVDIVRRAVERYDRLAGIMAMMSVAGGTGSGVGTYTTQCLRDTYPNSFILNHLIWHWKGKRLVIIQNYNSICTQIMNIKHISFSDVNKVIVHQLGSVLQPALTGDSHGVYNRNPIGEGREDQESQTTRLQHFPNLLILQWKDVKSRDRWISGSNPIYPLAFSMWKTPVPFNKYKSATLVSNSQALLRPLDNMGGKAYIHQYTTFGISEEDFLNRSSLTVVAM